jgi:hypothetical protein
MKSFHILKGQVCEQDECSCCAWCEVCDMKYITDTGQIEPMFICSNCLSETEKYNV